MKSRFLIAALLAGSVNFAFAASAVVCSGAAGPATPITGTSSFIQSNFTPVCSNNVQLAFDQNTNQVGTCANSKKGKSKFAGNTNGVAPAVVPNVSCTGGAGTCSPETATINGC